MREHEVGLKWKMILFWMVKRTVVWYHSPLFFVLLNPMRARFGYTNCLVPYAAIHSYMGHSYWFSRVLKSSHCERSVPLVENGTSSSFPVWNTSSLFSFYQTWNCFSSKMILRFFPRLIKLAYDGWGKTNGSKPINTEWSVSSGFIAAIWASFYSIWNEKKWWWPFRDGEPTPRFLW